MKVIPWQLILALGVAFLVVKLLINLLVPIGVALVVVGIILYAQDRAQAPKVIKK